MDDYLEADITATGLDLLQIAHGLDAAHLSSGAASPIAVVVNLPQRIVTITAVFPIEAPLVGGPAINVRPSALLSISLPTDPSYG